MNQVVFNTMGGLYGVEYMTSFADQIIYNTIFRVESPFSHPISGVARAVSPDDVAPSMN